MSIRKDLRRVIDDAADRGWEATHTRNHIKLRHEQFGIVIASSTPSDNRALQNIKGDIRRAERNPQERRS